MKLIIKQKVKGNYKEVMKRFDKDLFEALKPKNGKMEVIEFTGSKKGDKVKLKFLSPFKADWISDIIDDYENENESVFVDVGRVLPFPLKKWTHNHIVKKIDEDHSLIIDNMEFSSGFWLVDLFMLPGLWFVFSPRKKIYKEYFEQIF